MPKPTVKFRIAVEYWQQKPVQVDDSLIQRLLREALTSHLKREVAGGK